MLTTLLEHSQWILFPVVTPSEHGSVEQYAWPWCVGAAGSSWTMSSRTKIEGERGTVTEFRLTGRHTPAATGTCSTNIQGLHYNKNKIKSCNYVSHKQTCSKRLHSSIPVLYWNINPYTASLNLFMGFRLCYHSTRDGALDATTDRPSAECCPLAMVHELVKCCWRWHNLKATAT